MRKWLLVGAAVVAASFFAAPAPAQEPVKSTGTVISSTTQTAPMRQRVGLLGRLRGQRTTMAAPATVETIPATPTKVKQAGATEPATPMATTQPQMTEGRQGILARLRGRLGR